MGTGRMVGFGFFVVVGLVVVGFVVVGFFVVSEWSSE